MEPAFSSKYLYVKLLERNTKEGRIMIEVTNTQDLSSHLTEE